MPSRGEIWQVDWSASAGQDASEVRLALVVQNDHGNHAGSYPNTLVVDVGAAGREIPLHVPVRRSERNGLPHDTFVRCESVMTVEKVRLLGSPIGMLTDEEMAPVGEALRLSLGLA